MWTPSKLYQAVMDARVRRDWHEARRALDKAAQAGDEDALYDVYYLLHHPRFKFHSLLLHKREWLHNEECALLGNPEAMHRTKATQAVQTAILKYAPPAACCWWIHTWPDNVSNEMHQEYVRGCALQGCQRCLHEYVTLATIPEQERTYWNVLTSLVDVSTHLTAIPSWDVLRLWYCGMALEHWQVDDLSRPIISRARDTYLSAVRKCRRTALYMAWLREKIPQRDIRIQLAKLVWKMRDEECWIDVGGAAKRRK